MCYYYELLSWDWYRILNGIGLMLDVIGVSLLFWWSPSSIKKFDSNVPTYSRRSWSDKVENQKDVNDLISSAIDSNINNSIKMLNEINAKNRIKSDLAIGIVIIGFLLQILSLFV